MHLFNTIKPNKNFPISLLVSVVIFLTILIAITLLPHTDSLHLTINIVELVVSFICTLSLLVAGIVTYRVDRRMGIVWLLIFSAYFVYFLGDLSWTIEELNQDAQALSLIADSLYLLYYPLIMISILTIPKPKSQPRNSILKVIEFAIIAVSSLMISINFLIGPVLQSNQGISGWSVFLGIAYPMGDLLLLWFMLALFFNPIDVKHLLPYVLLSISAMCMILADTIFLYQTYQGTYETASLPDLGWLAAFLLTGLAGISQYYGDNSEDQKVFTQLFRDFIRKLTFTLPYIWVGGSFFFLVSSHYQSMALDFGWMALVVSIIISLLIIHQLVVLTENRKLNRHLDDALSQMKSQAAALSMINDDLSAEISERKCVEEKLAHHALFDSLTGLPNRVLLMDRLQHAIEYAKRHPEFRLSVLFLDLDYFKVINDSLGHTVGDDLLIQVSNRLRECLRSSDTIARLGGDEFVILLEDSHGEHSAVEAAERIQDVLRKPFILQGHEVVTSSSIGIVCDLDGIDNPDEIIRDADIAMYRAKESGKAQYIIFDSELLAHAITRMQMEGEIRQALERQEFTLYYQPIFNLAENSVAGFEALIRWIHPEKGFMLPGDFLPVAEECGLIIDIGDWVLKEACAQMRSWNQISPRNENLIINVNISSRQFAQVNFFEKVEQVLAETGLANENLRLEITEHVVIENLSRANEMFQKLRKAGIRLQVDDFGTGYSSLSYLQHFPIQGIKIDKSFIQEMDKPGKNSNLVHTILMMARDLGMEAIAEGVETESQLGTLKEISCDYGQGYLLARPMDSQSAEKLLLS